ncbi:hypothetical protein BDQ17DRAFT_1426906 [Cyathus striatus]|nr:hypothetical protein BDQ17DRAFT_1426906 [Cyathus striatus]
MSSGKQFPTVSSLTLPKQHQPPPKRKASSPKHMVSLRKKRKRTKLTVTAPRLSYSYRQITLANDAAEDRQLSKEVPSLYHIHESEVRIPPDRGGESAGMTHLQSTTDPLSYNPHYIATVTKVSSTPVTHKQELLATVLSSSKELPTTQPLVTAKAITMTPFPAPQSHTVTVGTEDLLGDIVLSSTSLIDLPNDLYTGGCWYHRPVKELPDECPLSYNFEDKLSMSDSANSPTMKVSTSSSVSGLESNCPSVAPPTFE